MNGMVVAIYYCHHSKKLCMIYWLNDINNVLGTIVCSVICLAIFFSILLIRIKNKQERFYIINLDSFGWVFLIQMLGLIFIYTPMKALTGSADFDFNSILQFFNYCMLYPVVTEVIVCGVVMRIAIKAWDSYIPVVLSALVIALLQERQLLLIPSFVISLSICFIFYKTHSFLYAVFIHIVINCMTFMININPLANLFLEINIVVLMLIAAIGAVLYLFLLNYVYRHKISQYG